MVEPVTPGLEIIVRFPLGAYHAQAQGDFTTPEWPPHPVRLIAAFVGAAASLDAEERGIAREAIQLLSSCPRAPLISAPRLAGDDDADGIDRLAPFRGASRWAPRNHQLSELTKAGVHPRDIGRGRAEVNKGGVAVGELPVTFTWRVDLNPAQEAALQRTAEEVTVLGTSRSPVVVEVVRIDSVPALESAWFPAPTGGVGAVEVRVPTPELPRVLDEWHSRRARPARRSGVPGPAGFVVPASLGRLATYRHRADRGTTEDSPFDPRWWGDMLVVAVDAASIVKPKAAASFAVARAARAAVLSQYADAGARGEAPPVLRGRDGAPHAAFVPLPYVANDRADGRILGIAVLLPHPSRMPEILEQRREVERGLLPLVTGDGATRLLGVPGIGDVTLGRVPTSGRLHTLREERWRRAARTWSTVTPAVHSRYRRNRRPDGLLEQVAADCRDVGLPSPVSVEVRRASRFTGAAVGVARRALPEPWLGPLRGPINHLDLEFEHPVSGPLLLGRARHFGLGLCLPYERGS